MRLQFFTLEAAGPGAPTAARDRQPFGLRLDGCLGSHPGRGAHLSSGPSGTMRVGLRALDGIIAALDVVQVEGLAEGGNRDQAREIGAHIRVIGDAAQVALEEAVIGGVEARERHEDANVGLRKPVAEQEWAGLKLSAPACRVSRRSGRRLPGAKAALLGRSDRAVGRHPGAEARDGGRSRPWRRSPRPASRSRTICRRQAGR